MDATRQDVAPTKKSLIKEVTPAITTNAVVKEKTALQKRYPELNIPDDWDKPYPPQAYRADGSLKRHSQYVSVYTNKRSSASLSLATRTFSNHAERDIAQLLSVRPGASVVGTQKYGKKFIVSFVESLCDPVAYADGDSDRQKALKDVVREAKAELKAAYDRGEDIAEIMNATRKQYQELALYKNEIKQLVTKTKREAKERGEELSEQDRKDLIAAANQMLKDRGCEPLGLPETFAERAIHDVGNDTGDNEE